MQRVWDLPIRLFHWVLVLLIALQYATGKFQWLDMRWHFYFGYTTLALIGFRIAWGFFGSQTSRFGDFVRGPRAVWRYLRAQAHGAASPGVGHNPLGGWSVLALLASIAVQAISGLFASDDIDTDGPFAAQVTRATVRLMTRVHVWNQSILLILIALHIVAVLSYWLLKHDDLITPMITGVKRVARAESLRFANAWLALLLFGLCVGAVAWLLWQWGE
jgi:cytochrome b